jgi:hypothetical protein
MTPEDLLVRFVVGGVIGFVLIIALYSCEFAEKLGMF